MHFLGLAMGPKNTDEVDAQLEQWSEYTEVEPYVVIPNEDVMAQARAWAEGKGKKGMDDKALLEAYADWRGYSLNEDGDVVDTMPEDVLYDWYEIGGRWNSMVGRWQGRTVRELRGHAKTDTDLREALDDVAVVCHADGYDDNILNPLAGLHDGEHVWFVDFHD